jgi:hypothetical protein
MKFVLAGDVVAAARRFFACTAGAVKVRTFFHPSFLTYLLWGGVSVSGSYGGNYI